MERSLSQRHLHRHAPGPSAASRRGDPPGGRELPDSRKPTGSGSAKEENMNPLPNTDLDQYVQTVLTLYLELPETPWRATPQDQRHARQLQQRGVPLMLIESALLLASLRRLLRPPGSLPLSPIRSFAYFQPVIEELL